MALDEFSVALSFVGVRNEPLMSCGLSLLCTYTINMSTHSV